jgi:hypothetical protein
MLVNGLLPDRWQSLHACICIGSWAHDGSSWAGTWCASRFRGIKAAFFFAGNLAWKSEISSVACFVRQGR